MAARIPEHARDGRDPLELAQLVATRLGKALGAERVSAVAPGTRVDETPSVQVAYVERRSPRPVGLLSFVGGAVSTGFAPGELAPAHLGQLVGAWELVTTGLSSVAIVRLADQSQIWVAPASTVRFGRVILGADDGRSVRVEILAGHAEILAHPSRGRFDVVTPAAIAGVRGTRFRVVMVPVGTRLETLEGEVAFDGAQGATEVHAGQGSRVDRTGVPEPPRDLLVAPSPQTALHGPLGTGEPLSWSEVAGAAHYQVLLARDAAFTERFEARHATGPRLAVPADLAPGRWFWRVRAVDGDGFVGFPSKIYAFTR